MSEHNLPQCQEQTLAGEIHRGISRMPVHMEGLEVNPHGVSGVRETAVRQSVCQEQMAKFIVDSGLRDRQDR